MKIGVVQSNNLQGLANLQRNREANQNMIEAAFRSGAEVVVLPECSNHHYIVGSRQEADELAETLDGPSVSAWRETAAAHGGYIAGGIIEREAGRLYNTAVLVGPGGIVGRYRKVHLFDWETEYLTPGNLGFPLFYLESLDVHVGMLICYDLRFPEAVRSLALAGCELLLVPTTWTSIGKSILWDEKGYCLANYLAVAHSYSNRISIACANRAGGENGVQFLGSSLVVDSQSRIAAGPAAKREADVLIAEIDPKLSRNKRVGTKNDLLLDRCPGQYTLLVKQNEITSKQGENSSV
ncbi:nitrilase-related carbon-nitrogen hydrolase [Brevibacillus massiliensis]|jgi:predicted amidohydrolase|uniref:nitrilase-related carbon-nitrogen hydrolase n=1 Tax=Brevibacillus massiliensis TaxID=1118054 RepID=UPI0002D2F579|nr:nitrilase-related carbon-nitrogen hydrolase [Brevibacillus massiliensis]